MHPVEGIHAVLVTAHGPLAVRTLSLMFPLAWLWWWAVLFAVICRCRSGGNCSSGWGNCHWTVTAEANRAGELLGAHCHWRLFDYDFARINIPGNKKEKYLFYGDSLSHGMNAINALVQGTFLFYLPGRHEVPARIGSILPRGWLDNLEKAALQPVPRLPVQFLAVV